MADEDTTQVLGKQSSPTTAAIETAATAEAPASLSASAAPPSAIPIATEQNPQSPQHSPPKADTVASPPRVHTSIALNKAQNTPPTASPTGAEPERSFQSPHCPLQQSLQPSGQPPAAQAQGAVADEVEDNDPFEFSDYQTDAESLTESINSLNYQYREANGRRYHGFGEAAYLLPNDEREQERLEGQHQMWIMVLKGRLHLAPLKPDIQNVLDVATGTGNWAMDFADEYPSAKVIGTDLSPIQPNLRSVPPNCSFIVEDSESEWMWDEPFDFIHNRTLGSAWRDWPGYFQKCYQHLKPGGWLESHEFTFPFHCDDDSAPPDNAMMKWSILFNEACAKGGVDLLQCANLDRWLRDAGFVNVTKTTARLPFSGWSKNQDERRIGRFYGQIFDWGVSMALFTRRLGWSREQVELFLVDARKQAASTDVHAYIPLYIYTAQKPESSTV